MRRNSRLFAFVSFIFAFIFASGASAVVDKSAAHFQAQMILKTNQLSEELQQFKNREKSVPKEKKESFRAAVTDLDSKFATLDQAVKTLKPRPGKSDQAKVHSLVSRLERQLDKNESDFSDTQFGLGSLLGF